MRTEDQAVQVINPLGRGTMTLVCEHASNYIPEEMHDLGLNGEMVQSHNAWDPGALELSEHLSQLFDAPLVASCLSRLVYDCNRPPGSPTAIVSNSDEGVIPGNSSLSDSDRDFRVAMAYAPFTSVLKATLAEQVLAHAKPVVVTIHSFTPIYKKQKRHVEIGILHDRDSRLADAMLGSVMVSDSFDVRRNEPYSPTDGVTHTLREHALPANLLNVMIEVRNDLLTDHVSVDRVSRYLYKLIFEGLEACQESKAKAS